MTPTQKQFAAELEPLLMATEQAIMAGDRARCQQLSIDMVKLTIKYSKQLDRDALREVLNSPTATAIATKLGVQPR